MKTYNIELNGLDIDSELGDALIEIMHKEGVFSRLLHDDITLQDIVKNLSMLTVIQVAIDGEFAGFFSLEDLGEHVGRRVIEVHAYLLPHMRSHSKMLIEEMINFIFANTSFSSIITSVCDKYPLIQRFIKMAGFQDFMHREDLISFDGKSYGMSYYFHDKKDIPIIQE